MKSFWLMSRSFFAYCQIIKISFFALNMGSEEPEKSHISILLTLIAKETMITKQNANLGNGIIRYVING